MDILFGHRNRAAPSQYISFNANVEFKTNTHQQLTKISEPSKSLALYDFFEKKNKNIF